VAIRLGLTGGIGSGKSAVARVLTQLGAVLIDADAISRQTTASGGSAVLALISEFGTGYIANGALDRERIRQLVFKEPSARQRLEAIIHPLVGSEIARQTQVALQTGAALIVFDIPLLVESGARWRSQLSHIWVIDCTPATQVTRVSARDKLSDEIVEKIMAAQAPRALRLSAADAVLFNDGISLEQLHTEVTALAKTLGL
jgi:dephospho-CoA kinase